MEIERKIQTNGKRKRKDKEGYNISLDLSTLNIYCEYILSENAYIKGSNLQTMKKLFDNIDHTIYQGDPDREARVEFITRGLDARLNHKIRDRKLIEQYINGGPMDKPLLNTSNFHELSTEDIDWINTSLSETVKYLFMYDYMDQISDLYQRFKSENYKRRADVVHEFEALIDHIKNEFRKLKAEELTESEFSLMGDLFKEVVGQVYARETSPSRRLKLGFQGMNLMLGGGLESQRVYMLFGTAAAGKSFTMLDMMLQIKKYNRNYICHDKTKRPCIVLLTMENSVHETVTRLFGMVTGDTMQNYTLDEVLDKLQNQGNMVLTDDNPIDIYIKYKANLSVDTSYLYTLYEDLEDQGYEPIIFFQDHIKRIKPAIPFRDLRLDLGEIVNEFKAFANEKDIPVVTDSHLNRDAAKILDEAAKANKQDLARLLGRSTVSESMLMIDNCDLAIIITKDHDKYGKEYMGFVQVKTRTKCDLEYFAQPFIEGNNIKLVEDVDNPVPAYRVQLHEQNLTNNTRSDYGTQIQRIEDDDDDLFSSISSSTPIEDMYQNNQMIPAQPGYTVIGGPSESIYPMADDLMKDLGHNIIMNSINDSLYKELITKYPDAKPAMYYVNSDGTYTDTFGRPYFPEINVG